MILPIAALAASLVAAPSAQEATPPLYEFRPVDRLRGEAVRIPFDSPRTIGRPSLSARHALLVNEGPIPERGVPFTVRCRVSSQNGSVANCEAPEAPARWHRAALGLASLYKFDVTGLFRDGVAPFDGVVTISDRIAPADVQPAARRFRFIAPAPAEVVFTNVNRQLDTDYYPQMAIRYNEQTRMQVDCEVQPDLSLFCLDATVWPELPAPEHLGLFKLATYQIVGIRRVAPQLANGAPAPGTIFRYFLTFRLPQD